MQKLDEGGGGGGGGGIISLTKRFSQVWELSDNAFHRNFM